MTEKLVSLCVTMCAKRSGPYSRCSTEIEQDLALLQEVVFPVQLDEFERGPGSVALFLRKLVPFVEPAFAVLFGVWCISGHTSARAGTTFTFFCIPMTSGQTRCVPPRYDLMYCE